MASTIVSYDSAYQDFVSFVSAFAQQENIVIAVQRFQNKESSEIEVARELIRVLTEVLGLTGVTFTLDALHCQKKRYSKSAKVVTIILLKSRATKNVYTRRFEKQ
ncbi:MAG: hypothetical protein H6629_23310 [Calditrichae bacterium]|nr:hypothetical protein [Calditrichia bacterium]